MKKFKVEVILIKTVEKMVWIIFSLFVRKHFKAIKQEWRLVDPALVNVNDHSQMYSTSGKILYTLEKREMINQILFEA